MPTALVVPLISNSPPLAQQAAAARAAGADLIELRVDAIGDIAAVEQFLREQPPLPCILTIRHASEGGHWDGDEAERVALFERLGLLCIAGSHGTGSCGAGWQPVTSDATLRAPASCLDIELASWTRSANLRQKIALVSCGAGELADPAQRPRCLRIVSRHDYSPSADIAQIVAELRAVPDCVHKAVVAARDARDALRVLIQQQRHAGDRLVALATGEAGLATRVLARKFAAPFTFAVVERGRESAPGQPTVAELRDEYRWDDIGPGTAVLGIIGWPVAHSRSPRVHNAAMRAAGVDGVFLRFPLAPDYDAFCEFMALLDGHPNLGVRGFAVTLPHKEHAHRWLSTGAHAISPLADRARAVNTLTRDAAGRWSGENTDAVGILGALQSGSAGILPATGGRVDDLRGRRVDLLGAGGAARAALAALQPHGAELTIYNRSAERAAALAAEFGCRWRPWEERVARDGQIVINCTSVGLHPDVEASPLPGEALHPGDVVFDTIYTPPETRLLRDARQRGCRVATGVAMFLAQGAEQFRLWHGRTWDERIASVEALR